MKTKNIKQHFQDFIRVGLACAMICGGHKAFAGERGGNGGDGIEIDGKLYVLDLVEAGVEDAPYVGPVDRIAPMIRRRIEAHFSQTHFPVELIATKLADIEAVDPVMAHILLRGMELYNWRLVNGGLVDIQDENSLLDYANLSQLAIRRNSTIMINRVLWERLDAANRAALVFHEIVYALVKPVTAGERLTQDSVVARELTGYLFSQDLPRQGIVGLSRIVGEGFTFRAQQRRYPRVASGESILHSPEFLVRYPGGPRDGVVLELTNNGIDYDLSLSNVAYKSCVETNPLHSLVPFGNNVRVIFRAKRIETRLTNRQGQTYLQVIETEHVNERPETINTGGDGEDCLRRVNGFLDFRAREIESLFYHGYRN
jgi:hypothetical protein